jgi:hypothetical protein
MECDGKKMIVGLIDGIKDKKVKSNHMKKKKSYRIWIRWLPHPSLFLLVSLAFLNLHHPLPPPPVLRPHLQFALFASSSLFIYSSPPFDYLVALSFGFGFCGGLGGLGGFEFLLLILSSKSVYALCLDVVFSGWCCVSLFFISIQYSVTKDGNGDGDGWLLFSLLPFRVSRYTLPSRISLKGCGYFYFI